MDILSYKLGKAQGGGSPTLQSKSVTITENGSTTVSPDTGYDGLSQVSVTTNVPTGGSTVVKKDVNFYDYDGTLTNSYTKAEFLALETMPDNPTHDGLISQGWNWSLSDAKTYVTSYDKLNVGQMYNTNDGSVRIHIKLQDGRLSPYLGFAVNGTATIDWGDNTAISTVTGTSTSTPIFTLHNYSQEGEYIISINSESDIYILGNSSGSYLLTFDGTTSNEYRSYAYRNSIIRVDGLKVIYDYSFQNCFSLSSVILSSSATNIGTQAFHSCRSLSSIIIPNGMTSIGANAFQSCASLFNVIISNSVTNISSNAFQSCVSLFSIIIPSSITVINISLFQSCTALSNVIIPNSITAINNYAFQDCYDLPNITIPNKVAILNDNVFSGGYCLVNIKIPKSVTQINNNVFKNCRSIAYYDFSEHTSIPTLLSTTSFSNIPSDCKIIVPDDLYNNWVAANNWSTYSSYIIKKTDWDNL